MARFFKILSALLILCQANNAQTIPDRGYASNSVLASGEWFRIAVTADGVYRLDYSRLRQLGLSNPSNTSIYGNNEGQLSYYTSDPSPDDLKEIATYVSTGSDGIFNEGDYLLFYGKGTHRWKYDKANGGYKFVRHNYSDTAFYFITSGPVPAKRISEVTETSLPENYISSASDALFVHEQENVNLISSGREWFQQISSLTPLDISPEFKDLDTSEKIRFRVRIAARAQSNTSFSFFEGSSLIKNIQVGGVNFQNTTGTWAQIISDTMSAIPTNESPRFEVKFNNNGQSGAAGWIDYVQINARSINTFSGDFRQYYDYKSVGPDRTSLLSIKTTIDDAILWDVTDPFNISNLAYRRTGDAINVKLKTDSLRTIIAFTSTKAVVPVIYPSPVPNQDLHSSAPADMVIVTHPFFKTYALELAELHYKNSGLVSLVCTPGQIYNEFSGGIPDIAAIRNFMKMKYIKQKGTSQPLKYLLLFGDGSYENKKPAPDNPNFIPTYQSQNSNVVVSSFTSDDFYGLLEEGEGEFEGTEDLGIGRLPVSDTAQARIMLLKIKRYLDPLNNGDWKNIICLAADDEDGNTHMLDAEGLASIVENNYSSFNLSKIYLDAYPQNTAAGGQTYPAVNKAIADRINSGCLIFNYTGHGNEIGLADENIINSEDIGSWKNMGRLPLFITATCEFSRFDDVYSEGFPGKLPGKASAGEKVLFSKDGGAIALMSTTRVVYSAPNYFLNRSIFNAAFERDTNDQSMRLGDIIRIAKNNSGSGSNKRNFTLLGDPALKLAYPWHGKVVTDSINNVSVNEPVDSLKALSTVTISGHIENPHGIPLYNFNGIISPVVFDKPGKYRTLANDGGEVMEFRLQNNTIFSGKTLVKNGKFTFTFIVPRDIDYSFGEGKISYYASNQNEDMAGSYTGVIVGGFSHPAINDTTGPAIKLYMNDTLFRQGGLTDKNPRLIAVIEDPGGVNTIGSGIGHDLSAYLDGDRKKYFVLNNYFENDFDDYRKGSISYDLADLSEGNHSITLKAWDNFNNSSEETLMFLVESDGKIILRHLINYPNPFREETRITAEHNRPEGNLKISITIFHLDGRIVKTITADVSSTGYSIPPVTWDGNDDHGRKVPQGVYPYTVRLKTSSGETATVSGRMIIL